MIRWSTFYVPPVERGHNKMIKWSTRLYISDHTRPFFWSTSQKKDDRVFQMNHFSFFSSHFVQRWFAKDDRLWCTGNSRWSNFHLTKTDWVRWSPRTNNISHLVQYLQPCCLPSLPCFFPKLRQNGRYRLIFFVYVWYLLFNMTVSPPPPPSATSTLIFYSWSVSFLLRHLPVWVCFLCDIFITL